MIRWNRDPAAYGWRSRLILKNADIVVYDDDGKGALWNVEGWVSSRAQGRELTVALGKLRALLVYRSLFRRLTISQKG